MDWKQTLKRVPWLDIGIVVFLLSIIASIIIPRFMRLHTDVHHANVEGTAAALSLYLNTMLTDVKEHGLNGPVSVTLKSGRNLYVFFNAMQYPVGISGNETLMNAFDDDAVGAEACRDFFQVLMDGQEKKVGSPADYQAGKDMTYVAEGTKRGCHYVYLVKQPTRGKAYVIEYRTESGKMLVETEDMPKW